MKASRVGADTRIAELLESELGSPVTSWRPVSGGDIGASARVELACGRSLFVKRYATPALSAAVDGDSEPHPSPAIAEAAGLEWLTRADAIRIARVVIVREDWIALDWIESGRPAADFDDRLGRELARLHDASPGTFGLETDNWIGSLPQSNRIEGPSPARPDGSDSWAAFHAERRIAPLARRASDAGAISRAMVDTLDRVCADMPNLVGPPEAPARLHGDLWSGNLLCDEKGGPCLIDPAVYGGHREVDLAMMQLFGGFGRRVFEAYDEFAPLALGWRDRVPLYQLYPLLVHCCLFGSSYAGRLDEALRAVRPT